MGQMGEDGKKTGDLPFDGAIGRWFRDKAPPEILRNGMAR